MNRTKAFSYDSKHEALFQRLAREAKRESRTLSGQLIHVIKYYFDQKSFLKRLSAKPTKETSDARPD